MRTYKSVNSILGFALVVLSSLFVVPQRADAQLATVCVNCSDIISQGMELGEQINTQINTAQQLATQIQQYQNMVVQGTKLPGQVWGNVQQDLSQLSNIVSSGSNIAYRTSNLADRFNQAFPNFNQLVGNSDLQQNASSQYTQWSQENYDAARTSLQAAGIQADQMDNENAIMSTLQSHSSNAAGQMQAIQASNEIAAQQVQQMQKLRQLVMAQTNMQAQAIAAQTRKEEAERAVHQQFITDPNVIDTTGQAQRGGLSNFPTN
jgi:P-type conjugative transfer protein TrbJ